MPAQIWSKSYSFDKALRAKRHQALRTLRGVRGYMGSVKFALSKFALREAGIALILLTSILVTCVSAIQARAEEGFPFGMEMTLDALPQAGSKRIPDLEIGDN